MLRRQSLPTSLHHADWQRRHQFVHLQDGQPMQGGQLCGHRTGRDQRADLGVACALRHPFRRRVGIARQPRRARLGDSHLDDQRIGATRQPQGDDLSGAAPIIGNEVMRNGIGRAVQLRIGQRPPIIDQRDRRRAVTSGRLEQIGERLVTQQLRQVRTTKDGHIGGVAQHVA